MKFPRVSFYMESHRNICTCVLVNWQKICWNMLMCNIMVNVTFCTSKKCNQIHSLRTSDVIPAYASTLYACKLCTLGKVHDALFK